MNDSIVGALGNLLIAAGATALVVAGLNGSEVGVSVIGGALFVGGCLLRIEAAILRGQPRAPAPRSDPALAWRQPDSEVMHLPERPDRTRPWQEPEDQDGADAAR